MRIVHVEDFFHPDAGYQVNILAKYQVKFGHEVIVITSEMEKIPQDLTAFFGRDHIEEHDKAYEQAYGVKIIRLPLHGFFSGRAIFTGALKKTIDQCKPDVLFVHGNDTVTGMWATWNRKRLGCPLVLDSHMLEMASNNRLRNLFRGFYKAMVTPIVKKAGLTVIRTQDDPYVEKCLGIPLGQAPWISYGSDTMLFHPDPEQRKGFRQANGISEDAFVVVYAGKLDEAKGGMLLADLTCEKLETDREVVYLVVGNTSGEYGTAVEKRFSESPYRVLRMPTQKYRNLAQFFQVADLAVFPKQCSLSFYDVQACGLPVLFEDNTINLDRCKFDNGWTYHIGNLQDMRQKLEQILSMDPAAYAAVQENAYRFVRENYDYEEKAKEYMNVIRDVAHKE